MSHRTPLAAAWQEARYTKIPNAIAALGLTPREEQLVNRLLSHRWTPDAPIYPSIKRLAALMTCTRRTVQRTLRKLEGRGLLVSEACYGPVTGQTTNEYHLAGALLALVTSVCDQVVARPVDDRRPPATSTPPKRDPGNQRPSTRRPGNGVIPPNTRPDQFTSGEHGWAVHT
jgi:DNA-binding transcriptional MocR family regulator